MKSETQNILIVEDDEDHYLLTKDALEAGKFPLTIFWVQDGNQAMEFLLHREAYQDLSLYPHPDLILLDLNLPKKDGRETLVEIKSMQDLKSIPVVVLTTTNSEEDIRDSYLHGANAFIRKPPRFREFVETMGALCKFWFEIVEIPSKD